jgi:hypothetical protein
MHGCSKLRNPESFVALQTHAVAAKIQHFKCTGVTESSLHSTSWKLKKLTQPVIILLFNFGFHAPSIMPCRSHRTASLTISSLQLFTFHFVEISELLPTKRKRRITTLATPPSYELTLFHYMITSPIVFTAKLRFVYELYINPLHQLIPMHCT